ncbi:MAG: phosphoribosylformylglycinamidine synthase [Clostridia bacterium]|nr:phosphoribosylformylglycinamidine synthase [Clostridia bacterium]
MVKRIYVEKKEGFNIAAKQACEDFQTILGKTSLKFVRILIRYDIEGISDSDFDAAAHTVFSEPAVDTLYTDKYNMGESDLSFAIEYLPGQYDQRADSAAQCTELLTRNARPLVKCATVYVMDGISDSDMQDIKSYVINPVDSRQASETLPETLKETLSEPPDVEIMDGFRDLDADGLAAFLTEYGLAMNPADIACIRDYFKTDEQRDPSMAEIRVIDTYWSDHCRHTTFLTKLENVTFDDEQTATLYDEYNKARAFVYGDKAATRDINLMDIATLYSKEAKKLGLMSDFDESEEINACSIKQKVTVDGKSENYLIMFKNETHNHPTEIEPFGGAATCLGGAIRDPLSGRSYVYNAMRVTGSGDPRASIENTMPGKLPQRKITKDAAHGYSSYGNQIGLATGLVNEIYHEGYEAKRMEIGAVVASAPAKNVKREVPQSGDIVLLLGGATGRDGCGGATGSSKAHDMESIDTCGAEVQKGNPPVERKLQRLFRNSEFSTLIKRCNDFGAGGVCVAIGELADSLTINLDNVRKKYEGLSGVELAISESQERMAIVIDAKDEAKVMSLAAKENLHINKVADITDDGRMVLSWRGKTIVSLKRSFLDTNGAVATADVHVADAQTDIFSEPFTGDFSERMKQIVSDLNICSQKGLIEMFDSTIGASSVTMPLGGKNQLTPTQAMSAKVAADGQCDTASLFSYGFDPYLTEKNPMLGSVYAVIMSLAKLTATGGDTNRAWLTLQEYFERTTSKQSWGKPLAALLGAWWAQKNMGTPAIGGKDSMSGTFENIHVPPTLCSFAICTEDADNVISPEFKQSNNLLYRVRIERDEHGMPIFDDVKAKYASVYQAIKDKKVVSAYAVERGGVLAGIAKMALGNGIGATLNPDNLDELSQKAYGDIILESGDLSLGYEVIGKTGGDALMMAQESISLADLQQGFEQPLSSVFPAYSKSEAEAPNKLYKYTNVYTYSGQKATPTVVIPVFAGTNCEYDSASAFTRAGANATTLVMRNIAHSDIGESMSEFARLIDNSQILMLPGGFSAGDEPDGSGKFIATALRGPKVKKAVHALLKRDGLILGICNGFQALIKVGLVPYGEIVDMREDSPTLTFNNIGRHVSTLVRTRVASNASPWLVMTTPGDIHTVAVSHGEGRFAATEVEAKRLLQNGQIATQYVDDNGIPTMGSANPNGSLYALEGLLSPDGKVFGKMAHSERFTQSTLTNVDGDKDQHIFESGVKYFL